MALSELEEMLALHIRTSKVLPKPERELRFHKTRRWRFDFAWPDLKLACEVEGLVGNGNKGRHQTITGAMRDMEKYEAALVDGWCVYRCHAGMIKSGRALATLELVYNLLAEQKRGMTDDRRDETATRPGS
jgi:hypothetical protein